jgi:Sulfotransferase family
MGFWAGIRRRALDNSTISVALQNGYRHYRILRTGLDAYRHLAAELASVRDERDRILRSLETLRTGKAPLPPGLRGRQLCFLHIGKTAGTSVQHALFETMQGTAILHESLQNFDTVSAAEIAINDLVIGHFGYQHVAKLRADRFLMTFLRDPVERVISNYHFLRSGSPISRYSQRAIGAAKALTLSEFLRCEEPGVRMVTENFEAKALAFDIRPEHQHAIGDLHREAARNLATFDFVGIVEYFPESMLALSDAIGREVPIKRLNATAERSAASAIAPDDLDLIRRLNAVDIALYTAAKARFEQTILPMLRSRGITASSAGTADRGRQRNRFDIPRAIIRAVPA